MAAKRKLKNFALDEKKVKRVQKYLGTKSAEEAIDQAMDVILDNEKMDRAHEAWAKGGGDFYDSFGRVAGS